MGFGVFVRYDPDAYTLNVIEEVDLQPVFLDLFENKVGRQERASEVLLDIDRERVIRLIRTFEFENFTSIAGDAPQVLKRKKAEITDEFYDDYIRIVFGIVSDDEESGRSLVGDGVVVPDGATEDDARLFAVELMNRLIFIKFLEDKALVQPELLRTLKDTYENGFYTDSFYEQFLEALFYDVMNQKPNDRPGTVKNIELFQAIPYLNGGLFRPTIEGDRFDEEDFDVRNSVLFSIIDLLEQYSFSAEGSPTDLDPSILGNVFEKTINYITSENADTNKELGAYYTPSEITRFCAEETVRPALLDRFEETLVEQCEWPEHEATRFDSVYELIEGLPGHMGTIGPLLDEVNQFRVVDPACGSGHFLTSVLEEIVNIRKSLYAQNDSYPDEYRLKKTTVLNNIYGVDLMGPAVEIAKLRCWLSVISELETENVHDLAENDALALPNIAFNLREGNSLIGYTGFPELNGDSQYRLGSFSEDSVRERYQDIIDEIEKHEQAIDSETAEKHRRRAFEKLRMAREDLIDDIHAEFVEAGAEDIKPGQVEAMEPFNWVLEFAEVYAEGGFDAIVGNPPWDQLRPNREDFFSRYDEKFRTRSPPDKDRIQEQLLEDEDIARAWDDYHEQIEIQMRYFTDGPAYQLQKPKIAGRTDPNENNLAGLFFERVFEIAGDGGYVAQVLPGVIFNGSFSKDLRLKMLNEAQINSLVTFENKGIFPNIDNRYNFGVVTFQNSGTTNTLKGIFQQHDVEILDQLDEFAVEIPKRVLERYSPESKIFPFITGQKEVEVLDKILSHPSLGEDIEGKWRASPHRELDRARDADRFVSEERGEYPIYGGRNIFQFAYDDAIIESIEYPEFWGVSEDENPDLSAKWRVRERTFRSGDLKKAIFDVFNGEETGKSQKQFVNELLEEKRGTPLNMNDVKLDCSEYRIVYREIARTTDERTLIACVLPKGIICYHKLHTIRPIEPNPSEEDLTDSPLHSAYDRIFTDKELFVAVGLLNSIPFDFLMRTKVDSSVVMYKFRESQTPRLSEGDEWFDYIWKRAARLNCYGEGFNEMRNRLGGIEPATEMEERREVQAELDAAAFHAYGLDHEQTAFVLDDFHRVQNPRLMDDAYFEMVLEKYDDLAQRTEPVH